MTGPIQEMTRNNQQREPLSYAPITRHEKVKIWSVSEDYNNDQSPTSAGRNMKEFMLIIVS